MSNTHHSYNDRTYNIKHKCEKNEHCDDGNPCTQNICQKNGKCEFPPEKQGYVCRQSTAPCDAAEVCDGTGAKCPEDKLSPAGTICRQGSGDICDPYETCNGTSTSCPSDVVTAAGTTCRESLGVCDLEEKCTGVAGQSCPSDAKSTAECRAAKSSCDIAEDCDGTTNECPEDQFVIQGTSCIDGDLCSIDDKCDGQGNCEATNFVDCSSCEDQCNTSTCSNGTCVQDPTTKNGNSCDDGNPCTSNDICSNGICSGTEKDCTDAFSCTDGICDTSTGECKQVAVDEKCDDDNDCTLDICCPSHPGNQQTGCMNMPTNEGGSCDDRLFCTENTTCTSGICTNGQDTDCSSVADDCNIAICNEDRDMCMKQASNEGGACGNQDDTKCTRPDTCLNGVCEGNNLPEGYSCSDGNFCNGSEKCDGEGNCSTGIMPPSCDDRNSCTIDTCNDQSDMCINTLITSCVDNDGCCPTACSFQNDTDCVRPCTLATDPATINCPFSSDSQCCENLCAIDPWCCNVEFDDLCCENPCGGGVGGSINSTCCTGTCQDNECVTL